jgi:hypothetical protein
MEAAFKALQREIDLRIIKEVQGAFPCEKGGRKAAKGLKTS